MSSDITEAEVRLAYRLLLDRAPESAEVINNHLKKHHTLEELRDALMRPREARIKMLPRIFPDGAKWAAVDVLDRYVQWVNLSDRFVSAGCLHNDYDRSGTAYLISRLHEGATMLDLGANAGWFTLAAAKRVGKRGRVHSFEPMPQTVRMLRRTIADNDLGEQVTVWDYALSDAWGQCDLVWNPAGRNPGGAALLHPGSEKPPAREMIPVRTAPPG